MQQIVVFGLPEYEQNPHPPAAHGDPASPEILEIASRLQTTKPDLSDGVLCETCSNLNLTPSSFTPKDNTSRNEESMPLGLFQDVHTRPCSLCRLVSRVLDADYKLHNPDSPVDRQANANAQVSLVWTNHEDLQEVEYAFNKTDKLRVQLVSPDGVGAYNSELRIEPFCSPEGDPKVLVGRAHGDGEIDVELLKSWMKCCEDWHAGECKTSFRTKLEHPAARFVMYGIDVVEMRLKRMEEGERYCALSYVWGRKPFYRLLKGDLDSLMGVNGIKEVMHQLPGTIVGAMGLARDLGVRYLWVDSVCIPQDDDVYKAQAIGKMHLVYSKAEFTIVAASGSDSFYGLPGYGGVARDEPQLVQRVGRGGLVLGARARYQWSLATSPHGQRGWTYQEMCFSTRSIVFMNGSVYFQCRQAVWREDWALEHPGVRFFLHEMDNRLMQNTDLIGQYRHSLREFTRRKLTFQDDALNAYTGVLEAQQTLFVMPLGRACCGMHIGLIDWVILFYLGRGSKRHPSMPSWSWAGWIGEAFLPFPMFGSIQNLVLWEHEHCPAGITYFDDLSFVGMPGINNVLRITTLAAFFVVDPNTIDGPGFEHPLWRLCDRRGYPCGYVTLHDSTFWDSFSEPKPGLVVQVLVLSDMVPGQGRFPNRGSSIPYDPQADPGDEAQREKWPVKPFTNWEGKIRSEFDEKPLDKYNILVLVPYTKTVGEEKYSGLHEKIGMGVIHNQSLSWAMTEPRQQQFWVL
ncbi:hypothetical protein OQA88_9136 [Cercophora sp. LCS_1]